MPVDRMPMVIVHAQKDLKKIVEALRGIEFNCISFREKRNGDMIQFAARKMWSDDTSMVLARIFVNPDMFDEVEKLLMSLKKPYPLENIVSETNSDFEIWD